MIFRHMGLARNMVKILPKTTTRDVIILPHEAPFLQFRNQKLNNIFVTTRIRNIYTVISLLFSTFPAFELTGDVQSVDIALVESCLEEV